MPSSSVGAGLSGGRWAECSGTPGSCARAPFPVLQLRVALVTVRLGRGGAEVRQGHGYLW